MCTCVYIYKCMYVCIDIQTHTVGEEYHANRHIFSFSLQLCMYIYIYIYIYSIHIYIYIYIYYISNIELCTDHTYVRIWLCSWNICILDLWGMFLPVYKHLVLGGMFLCVHIHLDLWGMFLSVHIHMRPPYVKYFMITCHTWIWYKYIDLKWYMCEYDTGTWI